jgi:predicted transcriptional regulator
MSYHDLNSGLIVNSQRSMLNEENTVTDALKWMEAEELEHLIVISGQYFNKLISIEDLENQKKFETLKYINPSCAQVVVKNTDSILKLWTNLIQNKISVIAITDEDNRFVGSVSIKEIIQFFNNGFETEQSGSLIVIRMRKMDYLLSKIATIVEEHRCIILNSFITNVDDHDEMLLTIKLNCSEPDAIIQALERHEYDQIEVFTPKQYVSEYQERYDELMRYLDV